MSTVEEYLSTREGRECEERVNSKVKLALYSNATDIFVGLVMQEQDFSSNSGWEHIV